MKNMNIKAYVKEFDAGDLKICMDSAPNADMYLIRYWGNADPKDALGSEYDRIHKHVDQELNIVYEAFNKQKPTEPALFKYTGIYLKEDLYEKLSALGQDEFYVSFGKDKGGDVVIKIETCMDNNENSIWRKLVEDME